MTGLEETGLETCILASDWRGFTTLTALKQTHESLCHWQKEKIHLALAQLYAAHKGLGLQRIFEYLMNTQVPKYQIIRIPFIPFIHKYHLRKGKGAYT